MWEEDSMDGGICVGAVLSVHPDGLRPTAHAEVRAALELARLLLGRMTG